MAPHLSCLLLSKHVSMNWYYYYSVMIRRLCTAVRIAGFEGDYACRIQLKSGPSKPSRHNDGTQMRNFRYSVSISLTIVLSFAASAPSSAQRTTRSFFDVQSLEREERQRAERWATDQNVPLKITLADESIVEVVGLRNRFPVYFTTHNLQAGTLTNTFRLHPGQDMGLNLTGHNLEIGIWDAGSVYNEHQEFKNRVYNKDTGLPANHATHVAGTLIASGVRPAALGMAPRSRIHSYNWNFHASEMHVEAQDGLLISNHSYGRIAGWHRFSISPDSSRWQWFGNPLISEREDYLFGYYDREATLFDQVAYRFQHYLPVVSAGNERDDTGPRTGSYLALDNNGRWHTYDASSRPIPPDGGPDGFDTLTSMATAKNILTVGSVAVYAEGDSIRVSPFSSSGPTDDGRVKPDIVGMGENLLSSIATGDDAYAVFSGTSMATPNVAGSLVLLQQLARELMESPLRAATLKALVAHTAIDLGPTGPDYTFGWGLLNTAHAAAHIENAFKNPSLLIEEDLENEAVFTKDLYLDRYADLRITLAWTDPPGSPTSGAGLELLNDRTPKLVYDLDLRLVHDATGQEHLPYVLSAEAPSTPAVRGDNRVDPIEQIYVPNAAPGSYTLSISSKNKFDHEDQQPFSLVVSGLPESSSPIVLDTVEVQSHMGEVAIRWQTTFEETGGLFVIERAEVVQSKAQLGYANVYQVLATLPARGASSEREQNYSFVDPLFISGSYHYRILFLPTHVSTRILVSEFSVDMPAPSALGLFSVYPNPVVREGNLILDLPAEQTVEIAVFDMLGRQVFSGEDASYQAGRHWIRLDAGDWAPGVYVAVIRTGEIHHSRTFVVLGS